MTSCARTRPADAGFTLIEICVAMILLMLAATSVAKMFTLAIASTSVARVQTSTTILANQKLEQLRALTWTFDDSGAELSDRTTDLGVDPPTAGGSGLSASPPNTLDVNTPGYVDFLGPRGDWVGSGDTPPPTAMYIRRWCVRPLREDPETLILEVLVTTVGRDRQGRVPRQRLAGDALETTMLSRKAP